MSYTFCIDWVRHAESCINMEIRNMNNSKNKLQDNRAIGYQKIKEGGFNKYMNEPNLSYIGMQEAINLGRNYIKEIYKNGEEYSIIFSSSMIRTIMTTLLAFRRIKNIKIYVIPFITEKYDIENENNILLNSNELKKKIKFIKDWLENSWLTYYDDIEVIDYVNKTKDLLNHITTKYEIKNEIINAIDDYLQFRPITYKKYQNQNQNIKEYDIKSLLRTILKISKIPNTETNNYYKEIEDITAFCNDMLDIKTIRGPEVDFSLLEKFEESNINLQPNFDNFFQKILLNNKEINDKILNNGLIFCASHKNSLEEYFTKYYININNDNKNPINSTNYNNITELKHNNNIKSIRIINTATYREKIIINDDNKTIGHSKLKKVYKPISIRTNYENFEILNINPCKIESLKGILQYDITTIQEKSINNKIDDIITKELKKIIINEILNNNTIKEDVYKFINEYITEKSNDGFFSYFTKKPDNIIKKEVEDIIEKKQKMDYSLEYKLYDKYHKYTTTYNNMDIKKKELREDILKRFITNDDIKNLSESRILKIKEYLQNNNIKKNEQPKYMTKDVEFYVKEKLNKYFTPINETIINGGYYKKYMKYKQKYINLFQ